MPAHNIHNHYVCHKQTNTKYIDDRHLMPKEQKECYRGLKGCKEQLLISKAILQECTRRKKNVCVAWIDHKKAFDSLSHSWIIKTLELIGFDNIISCTKKAMSYWKTSMHLHNEGKIVETEDLEIKCGIFQGYSLSPLLFCISLIPLTEQVNKLNTTYKDHMMKQKYHINFTWMI